jgi:hypothetical protein
MFFSNIIYIWNIKARKVVYLMMQHITGIPRNQMFFSSLEDTILPENPAVLSMLCRSIILETLGFSVQSIKAEGRPSFDTKIFLKSICMVISMGLEL